MATVLSSSLGFCAQIVVGDRKLHPFRTAFSISKISFSDDGRLALFLTCRLLSSERLTRNHHHRQESVQRLSS